MNVNKINQEQKKIMFDFMLKNPELARNGKVNGMHGKKLAHRLWLGLSVKLNAAGPPVRDVRVWRKVYSDQKHHVKKKISNIKTATHDDLLSALDEKLMQAAGINNKAENIQADPADEYIHQQVYDIVEVKENDNVFNDQDEDHQNENNGLAEDYNSEEDENSRLECMVALLNEKFQDFAEDQKLASSKLDKLIKMNEDLIRMKERSLQMRGEQHAMDMALKQLDLEIKTLELKTLQAKAVLNIKEEEEP